MTTQHNREGNNVTDRQLTDAGQQATCGHPALAWEGSGTTRRWWCSECKAEFVAVLTPAETKAHLRWLETGTQPPPVLEHREPRKNCPACKAEEAEKASSGSEVWPLVIARMGPSDVAADMLERDRLGRQRYGVPLRVWNGRDAARDAYEEALDLVVYLAQCKERMPYGAEASWGARRAQVEALFVSARDIAISLHNLRGVVPTKPEVKP